MPRSAGASADELLDGAHPHQRQRRVARAARRSSPSRRGRTARGRGARPGGVALERVAVTASMQRFSALCRVRRSVRSSAPARSGCGQRRGAARSRSPRSPALSRARLTAVGPLPPLERPADPAQQAGGERDEDGQDQPHAQPAGEEEPHDGVCPARRVRNRRSVVVGASRTTIFPVLPPRRRSRKAGTASSSPSRTVSRTTSSPERQPAATPSRGTPRRRSVWSLTMKPRRLSCLATSMRHVARAGRRLDRVVARDRAAERGPAVLAEARRWPPPGARRRRCRRRRRCPSGAAAASCSATGPSW